VAPRVRRGVEEVLGRRLSDDDLRHSVRRANEIRALVARIRDCAYGAEPAPLPALETLIVEMIAIHFCSDPGEATAVLAHVLATVEERVRQRRGVLPGDSCRVVWVNPVADLKVMNLVEELGGRIAGSEYLFSHALEPLREDLPPIDALALAALSDPMIGATAYRARRVLAEARKYRAEGVIVSRIPGASHCAAESFLLKEIVEGQGIPVLVLTVPPLSDGAHPQLRARIQSFFELLKERRRNP
jgi:benzoyl-CoA reductase subunit C